ncbi:MAG TPA: extracellular solute-binding protein [Acidimicrobiales bacterium]|nr:extracellular solute-binding protein [Acidimicrobiales bacterium]
MSARGASRLRVGIRAQRVLAAALGTLAVCGVLAACGTAPASPSRAPQAITLYSGQHEQTTEALVAGFEKATGITVDVRNGTEDTLVDQIVAEGGRSPADVIYTENSPALEYLQSKGLLAKVDAGILKKTSRKYDSPADDWVGVSARVSVIIYNPSLISESQLPTSVLQLANPRYRGKLAFAAAETDFQPIVTAVDRAYGRAKALSWLEGIKANVSGFTHTYTSNETIADEVNRGEVAFGVVNQYYWYRMRAEIGRSNVHSKIAYFAPQDPGYVVDVSGAAVLGSSKHKKAAQRFLAYLVGTAGQSIIADPSKSISFEYPIDSGVTTEAPETPFDELEPYPITVEQLGDGKTAIALLTEAGLL